MRHLLLVITLLLGTSLTLSARGPMYVVNGTIVESIDHIAQEDIERIDHLPADDDTIAQWGLGASEGVIIVTLRYDIPAAFRSGTFDNFTTYLAKNVRWSDKMEPARVSLRITVDASGKASISKVLQATSRQFLKRVEQAIKAAPAWSPAMRNGVAVESTHLINLLLPEGKQLPIERGVILL